MSNRMNLKTALLSLAMLSPIGASADAFDNMYVIGDSLSDQGNLFSVTGVPNTRFYYDGRFANGEVYAGFLAQKLGVTLIPSNSAGNNFANGGARTDYHVVDLDSTKPFPVELLGQGGTVNDPPPWSLNGQVETFQGWNITDPDALYVVFAGSNDLVDLTTMVALCNIGVSDLFCLGRGDPKTAFTTVIGGINDAIAGFVAAGATDILVPNLPNLGVVPGIKAILIPGFSDLATSLSGDYNAAFSTMLAGWEDDVNIIPFDTFSLLTEVVASPAAFGFANATEACYSGFVGPVDPDAEQQPTVCENPDAYVFWDYEHPTTAFHAFLADRMLAAMVPDILEYLKQQVSELEDQDKIGSGFHKKLDSTSKKLAKGKDADAVSKLEDFIKAVEAKQGKKIPQEDALSLIKRAEKIIALLDAQAEG